MLVKEEQCSAPDEEEDKNWDNEQEEDDETYYNRWIKYLGYWVPFVQT